MAAGLADGGLSSIRSNGTTSDDPRDGDSFPRRRAVDDVEASVRGLAGRSITVGSALPEGARCGVIFISIGKLYGAGWEEQDGGHLYDHGLPVKLNLQEVGPSSDG